MSALRFVLSAGLVLAVLPASAQTLAERVEGLLVGSLIGDAAGAPVEFAPPERSVWTARDTVLTAAGRAALADAFVLTASPRDAEPYGPWTPQGPPGTLTDDSRFKLITFDALARDGIVTRRTFAEALLRTAADTGRYADLRAAWLAEFVPRARWELNASDPAALPPDRLWGGLPTMAGQMPLLPLAALAPGDPVRAYRLAWNAKLLDTGIGQDVTAALVAGLAAALAEGATWADAEAAMRATDPFGYGDVPWVPRRLTRYLDVAHAAVAHAEGRAARLFAYLDAHLDAETWWEAWVPFTIAFACAEFVDHDPLAVMQLAREYGHDTDSTLQLLGAFVGALHGADVFPAAQRAAVESQLAAEYGAAVADWVRLLGYAPHRP